MRRESRRWSQKSPAPSLRCAISRRDHRRSACALLLGADVLALPFADNAFDCVICCELLEHLAADRQAVIEVVRVLRPGGQMVISVPRAGPERLNWMLSRAYHEVEGGHVRIYRRRPLVDLLESCELRLLGSHHAHGMHSPYWWLRCLVGVDRADQRLVARPITECSSGTSFADPRIDAVRLTVCSIR